VVTFEFARTDRMVESFATSTTSTSTSKAVPEVKNGDKDKAPQAKPLELTESNSIQSTIETLEKKGFNLDHYAAQEKPLFELVEGSVAASEPAEGENTPADTESKKPEAKSDAKKSRARAEERRSEIHSIPQILEQIKETGKRA